MKETCKFYREKIKRCVALRKTYCEKEECSFYKSKENIDNKNHERNTVQK